MSAPTLKLPFRYWGAHRCSKGTTVPAAGRCVQCWEPWPCPTVLALVRSVAP